MQSNENDQVYDYSENKSNRFSTLQSENKQDVKKNIKLSYDLTNQDDIMLGNNFIPESFKTLIIDQDKFIINQDQLNNDSNNFWTTLGKLKT